MPERDLGGPGVLGSTPGWRREREREALEDMVEEERQVYFSDFRVSDIQCTAQCRRS